MKRSLVIAGLVLVAAAGGILAYAEFRPRRRAPARGDPAIASAISVAALLRSETHRLSAEQIAAVLPLLRVLRDTGELGNTTFVFTSDNGYLLGQYRYIGKRLVYEDSLRVPLLVRGPGVPAGSLRRPRHSSPRGGPASL